MNKTLIVAILAAAASSTSLADPSWSPPASSQSFAPSKDATQFAEGSAASAAMDSGSAVTSGGDSTDTDNGGSDITPTTSITGKTATGDSQTTVIENGKVKALPPGESVGSRQQSAPATTATDSSTPADN